MDVKVKCPKIMVFHIARSFTEKLKTNKFCEGKLFFISSMSFANVPICVTIRLPRKLQSKYREML